MHEIWSELTHLIKLARPSDKDLMAAALELLGESEQPRVDRGQARCDRHRPRWIWHLQHRRAHAFLPSRLEQLGLSTILLSVSSRGFVLSVCSQQSAS